MEGPDGAPHDDHGDDSPLTDAPTRAPESIELSRPTSHNGESVDGPPVTDGLPDNLLVRETEGEARDRPDEPPPLPFPLPFAGRRFSLTVPRVTLQRHHLILLVILLVGGALRLYGIDWDYGSGLHPDERHVTSVVGALQWPASWSSFASFHGVSPLEPHDFAYGSLPLYLYWIAGGLAAWLGSWVPGLAWWKDAQGSGIYITDRTVSALAGVLTILVVYRIGLWTYGRRVALLAAAFFSLCVLDIQLSHFLTIDTIATLFSTLAVGAYVRVATRGRWTDYIWGGLWTGAALASKASTLSLFAPMLAAPFVPYIARERLQETVWAPIRRLRLGLAGLAFLVFLFLLIANAALNNPEVAPTVDRLEIAASVLAIVGLLLFSFFGDLFYAPRGVPSRLALLLVETVMAGVVFVVTQPYALIDWPKYLSDVVTQALLASGQTHVFYTDKFYNTPPFWYHLEHIVPWELGWPLGLTALAGLVIGARRVWRQREPGNAVLLLWTVAYFGATAGQFMKYLRYMVPIMPLLCLFAAAVLFQTTGAVQNAAIECPSASEGRWRWGLAILVLGLTGLYALSYDNVYSSLNTRLRASLWIEKNISPNTSYAAESPDETLPWSFPNHLVPPNTFTPLILGTSVGSDTLQAWTGGITETAPAPNSLAEIVSRAQYITISSARIMGTVPHLPQAFPFAVRYYCLLFGTTPPPGFRCPTRPGVSPLGFRLERTFFDHPHIGSVSLDDYVADQNFSEYDHPPVWIFKRVRPVSAYQTAALITDNWRVQDVPALAQPDKSLLLTRRERAINRTGPAYGAEFSPSSFSMKHPLLSWLFMVELLGLLALPLTMRLFRGLPERGFVIAKPIGLLLVGYLTWIAASLHLLPFSRGTLLAAGVAVLLASLIWGERLAYVLLVIRRRWSLVVLVEGVFLATFAIGVAVRMLYPDLWNLQDSGEKEMNFSYLNGVVRSQTMPPADPWFSGGYLNYYYYGYYLIASLIKLTGIAPSIAYNLALPTLFGFTCAVACTVTIALTRRRLAGLVAALFTGVAGNLYIGGQILGLLATHQKLQKFTWRFNGTNWGWGSSRVIEHTINEFPAFSFLYGDLHAHVMDMPITLCCIALGVSEATRQRSGEWDDAEMGGCPRSGGRLGRLLLSVVVVGATGPTNTWDLFTAILLVAGGLALGGAGERIGLSFLLRGAAYAAALGVGALVLYAPFYVHLKGFYAIVPPGIALAHTDLVQFLLVWGFFLFVVVSYLVVDLSRGPLMSYVRRLLLSGLFILYYWPRRYQALMHLAGVRRLQRADGHLAREAAGSLTVLAAGLLGAIVALLVGAPVLALLLLLLGLAIGALLQPVGVRDKTERRVVLALIILALGLVAVCEIFYLADFNNNSPDYRSNTVFKFYEQAWLLFGVATASILMPLVAPAARRLWTGGTHPGRVLRALVHYLVGVWLLILACLVVAVSLFSIIETPLRVSESRASSGAPRLGPTLDGTRFIQNEFPNEYAVLTWLNQNVPGDPTVLSADTGWYTSFGFRVEWFTGLPDLVQGNWEQSQQRYSGQLSPHWPYTPYPNMINLRDADVQAIYTTTSPTVALRLIHKYDVRYIYVGLAEHGQAGAAPPSNCFIFGAPHSQPPCLAYPPSGLAKFKVMAAQGLLSRAYSSGDVAVYKVTG